MITTDNDRFSAIIHRDPRADGAFFYAVKTTGIYCRPTCSSRRPNRKNILFFTSAHEAQSAGFRPCRKCTPHKPNRHHAQLILNACRQIDSSQDEPTLSELSTSAGLSKFHFQRLFKSTVGLSPKQYAAARRQNRLRDQLQSSPTITNAIYSSGFNSPSRAYETATSNLGMTPRNFRRGAPNLTIHYALTQTSLGQMLVAATKRGICMIAFHDSPNVLLSELKKSFPKATLTDNAPNLSKNIQSILRFLDHPRLGLNLPLDIQGTSFQQRVWRALQQIPPGQTLSYKNLAKTIGRPKAIRAVGAACAKNNLSLAIPCHRAISSTGALTGYRWGIQRKKELLRRES